MGKPVKVVFYLLMLAVCSLFPEQARAELWLKPEVGTQFGTTDFELELEQRSGAGDLKVRSLLAWPVDLVLVGAEAGGSLPALRASDAWLIEGRLNTSLGNSRGKMVDSDWISSRSEDLPPTLFARTESKTEAFALLTDLSLGYRFGRLQKTHRLVVDVLAGARLEYYALRAMGAEGKYLDEQGEFRDVVISTNIEAAVYSVFHVMPFVGSRVVFRPLPELSFPLLARLYALLSYSHDDHVLRNKDAFGNAYGLAVSASGAAEYKVTSLLSLGLSTEVYYLASVTGVLRQEFYDDDPGSPADERDSVVPDSDFAVESLRLQLMAYARLTF